MNDLKKFENLKTSEYHPSDFLDFNKFTNLVDFYYSIKDNWEEIKLLPLDEYNRAILAYLFNIYHDYKKLEELKQRYDSLEVLNQYMIILIRQNKFEQMESLIKENGTLSNKSHPFIAFDYNLIVASYYSMTKRFDTAQKYLEKAEDVYNTFNYVLFDEYLINYSKANLAYHRGLYYSDIRKHQEAIVEYNKAISILKNNQINDYYMYALIYTQIGIALMNLGSSNAKEPLDLSLKYYNYLSLKRGIAITNANLSSVMIREGKFEEALENLFEIIKIMESQNEYRNILITYNQIYFCLKSIGKWEEAEEYLNMAINLMKELNVENDDLYLDVAEFYALKKDFRMAEENLKKYYTLLKIDQEDAYSTNRATYLIYKAFIELSKRNIYHAENDIKEGLAIARKNSNGFLILQALMYYIELSVFKYHIEENIHLKNEYISDIELFSQEAIILLREYKSIFQQVNYYLLLSTVYILTNHIELATDILDRAQKISEDYNLQDQINSINKNREIIKQIIESQNLQKDIKQQIKETEQKLFSYSQKGIKEITYVIESGEKPTLLYLAVLLPSGIPIYSYNFQESIIKVDDFFIAGFIQAIQLFISEIYAKKSAFRMLEHSDYIVLLEPRESFTCIVFTDSFSYEIKAQMHNFADMLEENLNVLFGEEETDMEIKMTEILNKTVQITFQTS